jgi:hypothetical protein
MPNAHPKAAPDHLDKNSAACLSMLSPEELVDVVSALKAVVAALRLDMGMPTSTLSYVSSLTRFGPLPATCSGRSGDQVGTSGAREPTPDDIGNPGVYQATGISLMTAVLPGQRAPHE